MARPWEVTRDQQGAALPFLDGPTAHLTLGSR
jgi:hypothetical protein